MFLSFLVQFSFTSIVIDTGIVKLRCGKEESFVKEV